MHDRLMRGRTTIVIAHRLYTRNFVDESAAPPTEAPPKPVLIGAAVGARRFGPPNQ